MIVEEQMDCCVGRVDRIEDFEERDELAFARIYAARAWRPITAAIASAFVYRAAALLKFNLGVLEQ